MKWPRRVSVLFIVGMLALVSSSALPAEAQGGGLPTDTAAATRAGTLLALAAAIDGLAARWEAAAGLPNGAPRRLLTGGDAAVVAPYLTDWTPAPRLLFDALARLADA